MKNKLPGNLEVWEDTSDWEHDEWIKWFKNNPGVNLNIEDSEGKTLLDHFLSSGDQSIMDLLIKNGLDVNFKYSSGKSKLHSPIYTEIALSRAPDMDMGSGIELNEKLSSIKFTLTKILDYRNIVNEKINTEKINNEQLEDIFEKAKINAIDFLENCDGLAIAGNDQAVDPEFFNGTIKLGSTNKARSIAELALIHVAVNKGMPIIGCCGGHQIVNVYFGSDIKAKNDGNTYSILIDPESRLAKIITHNPSRKNPNLEKNKVTFSHDQVVDNVDESILTVTSLININKSKYEYIYGKKFCSIDILDSDIASTESRHGSPIATYQFHPELTAIDQDIIENFVKSCQTYKLKKEIEASKFNESKDKLKHVNNSREDKIPKWVKEEYIRTAPLMPKAHEAKALAEIKQELNKTTITIKKPKDARFVMEIEQGLGNFREILNNTSTKTQTQKIRDKNKVRSQSNISR